MQLDDGGVLSAGHEMARFRDVRGGRENGCREPDVIADSQHIVHREGPGKVRAQPLLRGGRAHALETRQGSRARPGAAQQDVAEADAGHPALLEILQPQVDEGCVLG